MILYAMAVFAALSAVIGVGLFNHHVSVWVVMVFCLISIFSLQIGYVAAMFYVRLMGK